MDIRKLFQQAANADSKKHSKKRTRNVIDSDSEDECVIYPTPPKTVSNKVVSNPVDSGRAMTTPLDYFRKYSAEEGTNDKESQLNKSISVEEADSTVAESKCFPNNSETFPPAKKLRTGSDSQEHSQRTHNLIQEIGELDIELITPSSPMQTKGNQSAANTSISSTVKCETPTGASKPALVKTPSSNAASYFAYMNRAGPSNLGGKDVPKGQNNCLGNLTFVITGVLDSMEREDAKTLILKYGGRVVGSLSKKVSHIVVGLEAGESKLEKARQLNVQEVNEDELLDLIRNRPSFVESTPAVSSAKKKAKPTEKKIITDKPIPKLENIDLCQSVPNIDVRVHKEHPILLVDKYSPTCVREIIGSGRDNSVANKLIKWLNGWFSTHRAGDVKPSKPANKGYFNKDPSVFKCVLLSGPPGIGKTTTATLVCKELGLSYVELNASSTRSKNSLQENVSQLLTNYTLVSATGREKADRHVLIMDEVDGMAGNEDRGGIQELITLIKTTKIPIICICNDKQHQKMRSLVHYCYDLPVQRPTTEQIKGAMLRVTCREGLSIPPNALEEMIIASGHDVRQVIHNISMWTADKKSLSFEEAKANAENARKESAMGPFDVIKSVFSRPNPNPKSNPINEKMDLFFQDYSFGPLFVQENYPLIRPTGGKGDLLRSLELMALTADSISTGDIISKRIRSTQSWKLLPMQGFFSTVYPGEILQGTFTGRIEFPKWFGNNSKCNKYKRIVGELCTHTRLHTSGSADDINMDYIPSWYQKVTRAIASEEIQEAAGFLCEYELLKEDWDSISELGLYTGHHDVMSQIAPKVKAQLTRTTNKERGSLHYKMDQSFRKLKVKQGDDFEDIDGDEDIVLSQETDDISQNQMIQVKNVIPTKQGKKPTATNKGTGKPTGTNKGTGKPTGTNKGTGRKTQKAKKWEM